MFSRGELVNQSEMAAVAIDTICSVKLIPTILCGGAGSRLWPVSLALHPKPFIRLADGQSLLQKAFLRGAILRQLSQLPHTYGRV